MASSGWPDESGEREYVTAQQVATYLQVHVRTVYNMALDGRLVTFRLDHTRAMRFRRVEVEAMLHPSPSPAVGDDDDSQKE